VSGITLDTGALIALERKDRRMRVVIDTAREDGITITVPAVVVIEWWRKGNGQRDILEKLSIEPTIARIAMSAGDAIAQLGSTAVDAAVMAHAALRGDLVYTSDFDDLQRLQTFFPNVRLLRA
jgi:hypothetical protein